MVDRAELRRLAEAAKAAIADEPWWGFEDLSSKPVIYSPDAAYIAAASPDAVLGLLDENEAVRLANLDCVDQFNQMREERDQLRAVLEAIAVHNPAVTHGWAEQVRKMARNALKAR